MVAERAAGRRRGRRGRPHLDQRAELRGDEERGAAVRALGRGAAELGLRRRRGQADGARGLHRARPTGSRRPGAWRSWCSSTTRRACPSRRRSIAALGDWVAANPGRFTYPQPPDFLGATFLKQAVIGLIADPAALQAPVEEADYDALTAPLWAWLDALRRRTCGAAGGPIPATGTQLQAAARRRRDRDRLLLQPGRGERRHRRRRTARHRAQLRARRRHARQRQLRRDPLQRQRQGRRDGARRTS